MHARRQDCSMAEQGDGSGDILVSMRRPGRRETLLEWASEHPAELNEDWELCRALAAPKPILTQRHRVFR